MRAGNYNNRQTLVCISHSFALASSLYTVLPRVFSLYQHLASKAILNNTVSLLKTEETAPVADTLCATISHLMSFIPSQDLQESLVRDLIYLAFDLAVISEVLQKENSVQVSIFEETTIKCKLNEKCVLTFNNMDSLYVTWCGTLDILETLLKLQKGRRLKSPCDETAESYGITNLPSAHADSVWSFVLDNGDLISTSLASIRKVLLSTPSEAQAALVTRNKISAAKLLNVMIQDWSSPSFPSSPFFTEVSLLVSRTVREHCQEIFGRRQKSGPLPTKDDLQLSSLFETLLCNAIIFPPTEITSTVSSIRAASLNDFLDCIPHMNAVVRESPFDKSDVILAHLVLRTIHTAIYTPSDNGSFALIAVAINHCTLRGIFPSLFHLSSNAHLGDVATRIIAAMLSAGPNRPVDVESTCRLARTLCEEEMASTDAFNAAAASEVTSPTSGSKRSGHPSQVSAYRPQRLQLRVERSPKRSRIGSATSVQPTPSPPSFSHASGLVSSMGRSEAFPSGNGSCHESLGNTLLGALLNAKNIVAMVDPCRSLVENTNATPINSLESNEAISTTIISVSSAFRLLLSLISYECREAIDEKANEMFQVATQLANSIKTVALSLSSHCKKSKVDISDDVFRCVNCVIRVGLEAQFAVGHVTTDLPKLYADMITACLDAVTVCARDIWAMQSGPSNSTDETSTIMQLDETEISICQTGSCGGLCCKLNKILSCDEKNSHNWLPCLCKMVRLPDALDGRMPTSTRDEIFQCDCTLLLFERMSTTAM